MARSDRTYGQEQVNDSTGLRNSLGPRWPAYRCAATQLRQAGYRVTPQRAQLLAILTQQGQAGRHLDAEALHRLAQGAGMEISLATVYRALAVFTQVGLVAHHHFGHDGSREFYEPATDPDHHHFTCLRCGTVMEVAAPGVQDLSQKLAQDLGVELSRTSLYIEGICATCRGMGGRPVDGRVP